MESRHARHWRAFVHELLYSDGGSVDVYDGACFISSANTVEYADGCFLSRTFAADNNQRVAIDKELAQFPALFERLIRRAVLAQRDQQDVKTANGPGEPLLAPALRVGGHAYQIVSATLSSASGVTKGRARGLVAQKLPFGVLLVAFRSPMTLERVFPRVDRACNALRR